MKKTYVKPMIVVQNFEMSQNIAACAWDVVNSKTAEECGAVGDGFYNQPPVSIFNSDSVCDMGINSDMFKEMGGEAFCYTTSTEAWRTFNS